jgi:hypothetical protein
VRAGSDHIRLVAPTCAPRPSCALGPIRRASAMSARRIRLIYPSRAVTLLMAVASVKHPSATPALLIPFGVLKADLLRRPCSRGFGLRQPRSEHHASAPLLRHSLDQCAPLLTLVIECCRKALGSGTCQQRKQHRDLALVVPGRGLGAWPLGAASLGRCACQVRTCQVLAAWHWRARRTAARSTRPCALQTRSARKLIRMWPTGVMNHIAGMGMLRLRLRPAHFVGL